MQLAVYVGLVHRGEQTLADAFRQVAAGHADEVDVAHTCHTLATWCDDHVGRLDPVARRYGEMNVAEPERLHADGLAETRTGPVGLLRDLQDMYLLATLVQSSWLLITQAAQGARDDELLAVAQHCQQETERQITWLTTRMKVAAPQALLVAE
jgi:hypothetical protein